MGASCDRRGLKAAAILPRFHVVFPIRTIRGRLTRVARALLNWQATRRISHGNQWGLSNASRGDRNGNCGQCRAWTLSKRYPATVYDREIRPGGHSHTVTIDYDGTQLSVDTGFIVYNELNYPDLTALFAHLGVDTVASCMSFAVTADAGRFEWKGGGNEGETAKGLFAQPRNLLSRSFLWMLRDILTFNTQSTEDYKAGRLAGLTLGDQFRRNHFAPRLLTDYLADGRRDLVGAGTRDVGLPRREFRGVLQQPSPAAIRSSGLVPARRVVLAQPRASLRCRARHRSHGRAGVAIVHAYVLAVKPGEISDAGIRQSQDKLFFRFPLHRDGDALSFSRFAAGRARQITDSRPTARARCCRRPSAAAAGR